MKPILVSYRRLLRIMWIINIILLLILILAPKPAKAWEDDLLPECDVTDIFGTPNPTKDQLEELFNITIDTDKPYYLAASDPTQYIEFVNGDHLALVTYNDTGHIFTTGQYSAKQGGAYYDEGQDMWIDIGEYNMPVYNSSFSCIKYLANHATSIEASPGYGVEAGTYTGTPINRPIPQPTQEPEEPEEPEEPTPPQPTDGRPDASLTFGNKIGIITSFAAGGYLIWLTRFREPRH